MSSECIRTFVAVRTHCPRNRGKFRRKEPAMRQSHTPYPAEVRQQRVERVADTTNLPASCRFIDLAMAGDARAVLAA